jgi:hypothetical protein
MSRLQIQNIPQALKDIPHWIIWRMGQRDGKQTKLPMHPRTGSCPCDSQNESNWTTFEKACKGMRLHEADGIGFVVQSDGGLVAGDLDHCRSKETGDIDEWAQAIITQANTYTEITPSGEGLRFFCFGSLPVGGRKRGNIELYDSGKFLTVTGNYLPGSPTEIQTRQDELNAIHTEVFKPAPPRIIEPYSGDYDVPEDELLALAFRASNGSDIQRLFHGDTSLHDGDESAADMALVSHLAFYAGANGQQVVDNLFRQSALYRPKWDEKHRANGQTYGAMTVESVYQSMTEFYEPAGEFYDLEAVRIQKRQSVNAEKESVNALDRLPVLGFPISKLVDDSPLKEKCQRVNTFTQLESNSEINAETDTETDSDKWHEITPIRFNAMVPFPLEVLPPVIRDYVGNVAHVMQVPVDLPAMAALAVLSFAVCRRWDVQVHPSYIETTNLYIAAAMEPGSRKSSTLEAMVFPLRSAEQELSLKEADQNAQNRELRTAQEASLKKKRDALGREEDAGKRDDMIQEITRLAESMTVIPAPPRLLVEDVTPERLVGLLLEQSGTMALVSSEGGVFGTMGGRYSDGQSNLDVYLKGHDGESYRVDRLNRPPEFLPATRLAICLTVQPDVLQSLTAKSEFRGRGLLGRFLYAIPADLRGSRLMKPDAPGLDAEKRHEYGEAIRTLLMYPCPMETNLFERHVVKLSRAALALHVEYANRVEESQGEEGDMRAFSDWASKLAGRIARIACAFHCLEYRTDMPHRETISEENILAAWAIAEYLTPHAIRAFDLMNETNASRVVFRILEWIKKNKLMEFSARDCHRALQRHVSGAKDIDESIKLMALNNYIRKVEFHNKKNVRMFKYEVNPEFHETKPQTR